MHTQNDRGGPKTGRFGDAQEPVRCCGRGGIGHRRPGVGSAARQRRAWRHGRRRRGGGGQCYLAGTHILTPDGPREIGQLSIGDRVTTLSGDAKPIKWIGRNRFVRQSDGTWAPNALPVKVARFALDGHSPSADLYLSAGHAVYVDGLLIQVGSLVNGTTIAHDPAADRQVLEYFHIELAEHDVVFAEGAATETLLPSADHKLFDNWREYEALYGAAARRARQALRHGDPSLGRARAPALAAAQRGLAVDRPAPALRRRPRPPGAARASPVGGCSRFRLQAWGPCERARAPCRWPGVTRVCGR